MIDHPSRRAFVGASAAAVGIGIGQAMPFPDSHWAAITALTLLRPGSESTPQRAVYRVIGTLVGALIVIGLYGIGDPQPRFVIPAALLVIGLCFLLMPYTEARYALLLLAITAGGFALDTLDRPRYAPYLVGYRVFHICVGSILVSVGTVLLRLSAPPSSASPPPPSPLQALDHSTRMVLACLLCLVVAAAIERPDYGGAMVITALVLGARTSPDASLGIGIQRLCGALFGGVLALGYYVLVLDSATSIYSLMIVIFVVCWGCLWLISVPSVSYLGFQIGFVFSWSMADARAPSGDVWIPIDRMAQVALGSAALLLCTAPPIRWTLGRAARAGP